MPDSKITALASIGTGTDPVNDALVIVDVSDVSPGGMSATGTTKRVSLNNLLASSPTATLASATITGDLTVDTSTLKVDSANNRVGIVTATPATALDVNGDITQRNGSGTIIGNIQNSSGLYDVKASANVTGLQLSTAAATPIIFALNNVEAMRLNSTGLGVGGNPTAKLDVVGEIKGTNSGVSHSFSADANYGWMRSTGTNLGLLIGTTDAKSVNIVTGNTIRTTVDAAGNLGIGVTPSAWNSAVPALQVKGVSGVYGAGSSEFGSVQNCFYNASAAWIYGTTAAAGRYAISSGTHQWHIAPSGTAGNAITFTQAMTLDASGNLLVGTTSSPAGAKVGAITKLSGVSAEGTASINVSTTPVALSRATGTSGLFFVMGYNASGGAGGWYLVASTGSGTPTVISSGGTPGLTLTFTMVGGQLNAQTASGTFVANAFSITA